MNRKTFTGPTRAKASDEAAEWWSAQNGLRQVGNWEFSVHRRNSPNFSPKDDDHWTITIVYEEDSNLP
jgi:hypothetical protein